MLEGYSAAHAGEITYIMASTRGQVHMSRSTTGAALFDHKDTTIEVLIDQY